MWTQPGTVGSRLVGAQMIFLALVSNTNMDGASPGYWTCWCECWVLLTTVANIVVDCLGMGGLAWTPRNGRTCLGASGWEDLLGCLRIGGLVCRPRNGEKKANPQ